MNGVLLYLVMSVAVARWRGGGGPVERERMGEKIVTQGFQHK